MYQEFIIKSLESASVIALEKFGKVSGNVKPEDSNQVLTEADVAVGAFLVREVQKYFPSHNIIDEEAGVIDNSSEFTWVIDPIDGTSNFAAGTPLFGIMIGLLHDGAPIAGGIALPAFAKICVAEKGTGAWCNGEQMHVSTASLANSLVAFGIDSHREAPEITRQECTFLAELVLQIRNLRTSNSSFDSVMVAQGKYGALLNKTSKIWDNVAQQVIIEEAGGVYTDFNGEKINYAEPLARANDNFTMCAAPKSIHHELQELIRAYK